MYAKNIELASMVESASKFGFQLNTEVEAKRIKFTLRRGSNTKYQKVSRSFHGDRKTGSVCLHGHYHFFKECFQFAPQASFESAWYGKIVHTADTLEDNYDRMRDFEVGSQVYPVLLNDCCDCGE